MATASVVIESHSSSPTWSWLRWCPWATAKGCDLAQRNRYSKSLSLTSQCKTTMKAHEEGDTSATCLFDAKLDPSMNTWVCTTGSCCQMGTCKIQWRSSCGRSGNWCTKSKVQINASCGHDFCNSLKLCSTSINCWSKVDGFKQFSRLSTTGGMNWEPAATLEFIDLRWSLFPWLSGS